MSDENSVPTLRLKPRLPADSGNKASSPEGQVAAAVVTPTGAQPVAPAPASSPAPTPTVAGIPAVTVPVAPAPALTPTPAPAETPVEGIRFKLKPKAAPTPAPTQDPTLPASAFSGLSVMPGATAAAPLSSPIQIPPVAPTLPAAPVAATSQAIATSADKPVAASLPKGAPAEDALDVTKFKLKPKLTVSDSATKPEALAPASAVSAVPATPTASAPAAPVIQPTAQPSASPSPAVAVPPTPAPTTVVAAAGVETPPIPAAPVVPPAAAKRPIAPSEPTDKPAFKAGIWVIVVVTIILLAVAGLLGHAVMVKLSNAKQATVTAPDKPAKPAVPAVSADQTVKPGRIVVDSPTSAPGKMIAKALDTVDAHNQSGLAQGVNEVLDNAPSGSAAAKPGIPTAASKVTVATNPAQPTETVASDSVVEAPAGLVAKVPEPPPEPSASFRTLVVNMKVSGVFQGNPGRALLNGRMLHTGESVDSRLNVILFDINSEKKLLVFKDTRTGATMSRHY